MNDIQKTIQQALRQSQGIRRRRSALTAIGTLIAVLAVAAWCDRTWMFSGAMRWSGWIAGLVLAAWAARRAAGPPAPDAATLAHQVESDAGETAAVVATAIDPAVRKTAGEDPVAQALLERLDDRAAKALDKAPPSFKGRLRTPLVLAAAAIAGLAALVGSQGEQGLLRTLMPWQPSPYTRLALTAPAEPIAEGAAFQLTAVVSGVPVDKVTVYRQGSTDVVAEATPDEQGRVQLMIDGLDGPAIFVAHGGDGQSEPLPFAPYYLPRIETFDIGVTPPGYGAHAADTETHPSFSALRGSRLRYRIHLKAPAVSVAFERSAAPREDERISDEERANMQRGRYGVLVGAEETDAAESQGPVFRPDPDDPQVWEATWELPEPADIVYRLAIEGEHGDRVRNEEPWRITVLGDEPPKVQIHGHNGDEVIAFGDEKVRFDLSAVDDVGLAAARLVFRKPGQPHTRQEIALPPEARRTWSGAELLDLAPFDMRLYDILAVHFEAEDGNQVDGPGIGRSEVVFLEIPPLESADDGGGDDGGGGGGGGAPPINPLELQMEILRSTVSLPHDAPASEQAAIAHDQNQNADYSKQMEQAMDAAGLMELGLALHKAWASMVDAAQILETQSHEKAIPDEEAALGFLIEAAKLLEEAAEEGKIPESEAAEGQQSFTLRPPKGGSSAPSDMSEEAEGKEQELRDLMDEVRQQLADQEALNQAAEQPAASSSPSDAGQQAQQSLASDARASAGKARGMSASAERQGDPKAAAEELERAAALQEDTAEALAGGDAGARAELGAQSAEALAEALRELSAQLEVEGFDSEATTPGYERLINDYLRSISYE